MSRAITLTPKLFQALEILYAEYPGGLIPEDFYQRMWPNGKGGCNSTKGGPSGAACAASWLLGRCGAYVRRYGFLDPCPTRIRGCWVITDDGRRIVEKIRAEKVLVPVT